MAVFLVLCCVLVLVLVLLVVSQASRRARLASRLPGPRPWPIIGNALDYGLLERDLLRTTTSFVNDYGKVFRLWFGNELFVGLSDPEDIEIIMSKSAYSGKGRFYNVLKPWLGTGLLISRGDKWKKHRKVLTPAFHFKILERFVDVFNSNGEILVKRLQPYAAGNRHFNVAPFVEDYTLDTICETAMGTKVNAQTQANSEYAKHVKQICQAVVTRALCPWLYLDYIFDKTKLGKQHNESLTFLHNTSYQVIYSRKAALEDQSRKSDIEVGCEVKGSKERMAFLDLLLQYSMGGANFKDKEIREEVDTFMFEGHDTTSSGLIFTIHLLAHHQDIQDKVYEELDVMFGDSKRPATYQELNEMKYLAMVIKEALRLYPSVPTILRTNQEDLKLKSGHVIPARSSIGILIYHMHRNPDIFPDPDVFNPDRFLPEQCSTRHPFAYIPFSAGPRNCIGQKFAMAEMKIVISQLLRHYRILPPNVKTELKVVNEVILKHASQVLIRLVNRT